ncbi:hypothetical protein AB0P15_15055 [Streptomyces sp. NPDC087917]|uniref:hypothetical protein n=1 Tax=unclassified Streptomyces TaxID=2593676 RepID=UPI0034269ADE
MTVDATRPPVWFRLPPGFHDLSPSDRAPLDEAAQALESPGARQELARIMDHLDRFTDRHVVHTSIGLHPEGPVGAASSVFALSLRPAEHPNARLGVARAALAIARSPLWNDFSGQVLPLPSGLPCSLAVGTISLPGTGQELFQARLVTTHPSGTHLVFLDLTSTAVQYAEAYGDIIEAIAHTVVFSDPTPAPAAAAPASRVLEVLL